MKTIRRATQFFRQDRVRIAGVVGLMLLGLGCNILKPWPLAWLVDSVLGNKPWPALLEPVLAPWQKPTQALMLVAALLLFYTGYALLSAAQTFWSIDISLRGLTRVRNEVFVCLQRLSLRFHQGSRSGDLIYRAATDTYAFQTLFQQGFTTVLASVLALLLILVVMWRVNPPLTLLALAALPLLVLTIRYFGRQMRRRGLRAQQAESNVTSLIQQGIVALPLVQSYTREAEEASRFHLQASRARQFKLSQHGWEVLYGLMVALGLACATAAITYVGARQVLDGQLTVGQLLVFLAYLTQMFEPLNQLTFAGSSLASATAGVQRVFEILDIPEEVKDRPGAREVIGPRADAARSPGLASPLVVAGNFRLENVSFGYRPGELVLHNITFAVAAGESVAVVGPSGSGKTTLLNLLPRFFDPSAGTVLLENVDLRELRLRDLRSQISLLLQKPIILPTTVAENIAYGRPNASLEEIRAAARAANADEFISRLPRQYDTLIGEGAARLSVGEEQRLNLARAFLKDAPILLLDEPTSALDAESEQLIVQSLAQLTRERTTLMVAHRLSTIRRVHKIAVLEHGRLTQFGSSEELLQQDDGYYARVVRGQSQLG